MKQPWSGLLKMHVTSLGTDSRPTRVSVSVGTLNSLIATSLPPQWGHQLEASGSKTRVRKQREHTKNARVQDSQPGSGARYLKLPTVVVLNSNLGSSVRGLPPLVAEDPAFSIPSYAYFTRPGAGSMSSAIAGPSSVTVSDREDIIDLTMDSD